MDKKIGSLEHAIDCTVMNIRQNIMQYFSGENLGQARFNTNVGVDTLYPPYFNNRRMRHYEVSNFQLEQPRVLRIGGTRILSLHSKPNRVQLYSRTLKRSSVMEQILHDLEVFFAKYLPHVEVIYLDKGSRDGSRDEGLVENNKLSDIGMRREEYSALDRLVVEYNQLYDQAVRGERHFSSIRVDW